MFNRGKTNSLWVEKYRPQSLDEYIGNDTVKKKVQSYINSNDIPHLLFTGKAGTGKTTLAKIIIKHLDCEYIYINASDENGIDDIRNKVKGFASSVGWKPFKILILDEADGLTPQAQASLRNIMESYSAHCRFILTCNNLESIIEPIQSRCQVYKIFPPTRKDVAMKILEILQKENVTYDIKDIAKIVDVYYPDIRSTINSVNQQIQDKILVIDENSDLNADYKTKLLEYLLIPDYREAWKICRQLLLDSEIRDFTDIYRLLYDKIDEYGTGKVSHIILVLAEYQYKDALVVDKEINFAACLIELLKTIHS